MSTLKTNTITTVDGTGSLTVDRPLAGDGNALVGISPRNFIIDGDFTQWPEGTSAATATNDKYSSALFESQISNDGTITVERSTSVPTVAQSSHQSAYSWLAKCTGTDASIGAGQYARFRYHITGSDFAHLHKQQVTISFWAKTAAANSGDTYYFVLTNSAQVRSYVQNFAPTSSWTKFTYTITLDSGGTWLFTEADIGMKFEIILAAGSTHDNATIGSWVDTGQQEWWASGTAISNFLDSTSNEFYMAQFGLYLGGSAPTFTSPPISTVKQQLEYYIQVYGGSGNYEIISRGAAKSGTEHQWELPFRNPMRVAPTATVNSTPGNFWVRDAAAGGGISASTVTSTVGNITAHSCLIDGTTASVFAAGEPTCLMNSGTTNGNIKFDARH